MSRKVWIWIDFILGPLAIAVGVVGIIMKANIVLGIFNVIMGIGLVVLGFYWVNER